MKQRKARTSSFEAAGACVRIRELRASYVTLPATGEPITAPKNLAHIADEHLSLRRDVQENLAIVFFDAKNRVIGVERMFRGTVNAATVPARDIFRNAIILNAAAVAVLHNHPSGCTDPSPDDINFTKRLVSAAQLVGIDVLDHIIVGCTPEGALSFASLKERGAL